MKLINRSTNTEVKVGDLLRDFRNEWSTVTEIQPPHSSASTGRIFTRDIYDHVHGSYPSVYNCEWIDREDRLEQPASGASCLAAPSSSPVNSPDQTKDEMINRLCGEIEKLERKLRRIWEIIEGSVDGAEDASEASKLANKIWDIL